MNGKEIRKRLIEAEWSSVDLAQAAGIKEYTLSKMLNGHIPLTKNAQEKILKALHKREMARVAA